MSIELTSKVMRVREFRSAKPFKPFRIRIEDGREFYVKHPYGVSIAPGDGRIGWAGGPLGAEIVSAEKIQEVVIDE